MNDNPKKETKTEQKADLVSGKEFSLIINLRGELDSLKEEVKNTKKESKEMHNLVIFGFFVLLVMVVALMASCWQLWLTIPNYWKVDDLLVQYEKIISENQKITSEIKEQRKCIQNFGFTIKCFK